jgi:hypothetical protein
VLEQAVRSVGQAGGRDDIIHAQALARQTAQVEPPHNVLIIPSDRKRKYNTNVHTSHLPALRYHDYQYTLMIMFLKV